MGRFVIIFLLALSALLVLSFKAHATVNISYFYDGDTVKIIDGAEEYKLRITNIDAPERNQNYGKKSRRALMQLCQDTEIKVNITGTDKYRRKLGSLYCDGQDVAGFMLKHGHAWFNDRYSTDLVLALKERTARKSKLGLWRDEKPIAPWVWRRLNKEQQKKQ
ncbi:MAG: thermonuclease family protein [Methylophilaceae bacterium]